MHLLLPEITTVPRYVPTYQKSQELMELMEGLLILEVAIFEITEYSPIQTNQRWEPSLWVSVCVARNPCHLQAG